MDTQKIFVTDASESDIEMIVKEIFDSYKILHTKIGSHHEAVRRRWNKYHEGKRRQILGEIDREIPKEHRPDLATTRIWITGENSDVPPRRYLMWPHISHEDLASDDPRPMLQFLQSRSTHPPGIFADVDVEWARMGTTDVKHGKLFQEAFLIKNDGSKRRMELPRDESGEGYGRIVDEDTEADYDDRQTVDIGILTLLIQRGIYKFLVRVCEKILHVKNEPISEGPIILVEQKGPLTLEQLRRERAYLAPGELHLKSIHVAIKNCKKQAESVVMSMKQNPGAFLSLVHEIKEHKLENIKTRDGTIYVNEEPGNLEELWQRSVRETLRFTLEHLVRWSSLDDAVTELILIFKKFEEDTGNKGIKAWLWKYAAFLRILTGQAEVCFEIFLMMPGSIFTRQYYTRKDAGVYSRRYEKYGPMARFERKTNKRPPKELHEVNTFLDSVSQPKLLLRLGNRGIVDELEWSLHTKPESQAYLTDTIMSQLDELFLLGDLVRELDNIDHRASMNSDHERDVTKKASDVLFERNIINDIDIWDKIAPLCLGIEKRFHYPLVKTRTLEITNALQSAENALASFWATFETEYEDILNKLYPGKKSVVLDTLRKVKAIKTSPWAEEAVLEKPTPRPNKPDTSEVDLVQSLGQVFLWDGFRPQTGRHFVPEKDGKKKEKTTGNSNRDGTENETAAGGQQDEGPVGGEVEEEQDGETEDQDEAKIGLKADKLEIIRRFWHDPKNPHPVTGTSWRDFAALMTSMGFEVKGAGGSIFNFTPTEPVPPNNTTRSISIHAPHGSKGSKIEDFNAKVIGGRLARAYGWNLSTFILADKN